MDRRVVRPVEQITTIIIIIGLAGGDRDMKVPLRGRRDELGQMADAIETLRRNAIKAETVGREMLAAQHARADEKSRLLAEITRTCGELAALNLELESLAATDALTGLANRRSFDLLLAREWRRAQREETSLGPLLLDVDNFKLSNNHYGNPADDACLARVGASIADGLSRPSDTPARYGGEELAAILPATELLGAVNVAEGVRQAITALHIPRAGNPCGCLTVSIGAAVTPPQISETPEALVSRADALLYKAKHKGRNRVESIMKTAAVVQQ